MDEGGGDCLALTVFIGFHVLSDLKKLMFRYNYAEFWQAIINRDVEQIKTTADTLGVGELYGLFACMVTAR